MKKFMAQYRSFSVVLVIEVIMVLTMLVTSFRKPVTLLLDHSSMTAVDTAVGDDDEGCYITGRSSGKTSPREMVRSELFALPHGMYEVVVRYKAVFPEGDNGSDFAGSVQFGSQNLQEGFRCGEILLSSMKTSAADRLWVRSFNGVNDLEASVCFNGIGELRFSGMEIRELPLWRVVCLAGWLLFFAVADFIYVYFFTNNSYGNKQVIIGLGVTIFLSSLPLFTDFLYWGHDMDFHTARIWSLAEGIKNGHWIVPIQTEMVNGYGYATPLFYSQLFLYIPALIYCMGAPLQVCYQIYAFLANAAACLVCFYCMKGLFRNKRLALFGAFLYTFSSYRLADVYTRASVGEYTAMIFLPLILYGFARVYMADDKKITWRDYMPIVVGLTGIIRCHVLTCELSALCIGLFCLVTIRRTLQPKRLAALAGAALLTLAINAAFLIPFLSSLTMNLTVKANRVNQMQGHGTYFIQMLGMFMTSTGGSVKGTLDEMPMSVGLALIVGICVVIFCQAKKYDWGIENDMMLHVGTLCAGFAVISLVFSMHFVPWDSVRNISGILAKVLCMIQYPWRYYAFATVFGAFAAVAGIKVLSGYKGSTVVKLCCGVMIVLTSLNAGLYFTNFANEAKTVTVYGAMPTEIGYGEYLPTGTVMAELGERKIITDETLVTVEEYQYEDGVTSFWCRNLSGEEKTVGIPLLNYDNYHAYDLGSGQELEIRNGHNNCVDVVVSPDYEGMVEVRYEIPLLWKIGYAISAVSIMSVIVMAGMESGKRKRD